MIENLISIPGPTFLMLYIAYAAIIIYLAKVYTNNDYTLNHEIPEPTKLSPIEIAILKNGVKGAIITSIFNLWRQKALDFKVGKKSVQLKKIDKNTGGLNQVEYAIYYNLSKPRYYRDFYKKQSQKMFNKIIAPNIEKLKKLKLAADNTIKTHYWRGFILAALILLAFGGSKLYFGISRGKSVGFLVALLILSLVVLFFVIRPNKIHHSALGKQFLASAAKRFEWLKKENNGKELLQDENLLYGIACFGISAFMGTQLAKLLENPAVIEKRTSTIFSGCGYGCAGCGGHSCGGGGCSGGGCSSGCGGGCGGCGGCGG